MLFCLLVCFVCCFLCLVTSEFRLDGPSMAPPGRFGYPFDFDRLTAFGNLSVSTRYRLKQKVLDLSWCRETVTSRFREVPVFGNLSVSRGYRSNESSQFREVPVFGNLSVSRGYRPGRRHFRPFSRDGRRMFRRGVQRVSHPLLFHLVFMMHAIAFA